MRQGWLLGFLLALAFPAPALARVIVVTNLNDRDDGSLRQAITDAAANDQADAITFDAGGQGVIKVLGTALPDLGHDDEIVGPDRVAGKPLVQVDGREWGIQTGLALNAGSAVRNIAVTGFSGSGIVVKDAGVSV